MPDKPARGHGPRGRSGSLTRLFHRAGQAGSRSRARGRHSGWLTRLVHRAGQAGRGHGRGALGFAYKTLSPCRTSRLAVTGGGARVRLQDSFTVPDKPARGHGRGGARVRLQDSFTVPDKPARGHGRGGARVGLQDSFAVPDKPARGRGRGGRSRFADKTLSPCRTSRLAVVGAGGRSGSLTRLVHRAGQAGSRSRARGRHSGSLTRLFHRAGQAGRGHGRGGGVRVRLQDSFTVPDKPAGVTGAGGAFGFADKTRSPCRTSRQGSRRGGARVR